MIRARVTNLALKITADNEGRATLAYWSGDYNAQQDWVAECLRESWEFVRPEEVGALTDSPILADCSDVDRDDNGTLVRFYRLAWFPDYAIRDPWRELANTGRVYFTLTNREA